MFRAFAPAARSSIGAVPAFLLCLFGLRSTRFGGVRAPKEQSRVLVIAGPASADTSGGTRLSIEVAGPQRLCPRSGSRGSASAMTS
jgi:hypothetical protein